MPWNEKKPKKKLFKKVDVAQATGSFFHFLLSLESLLILNRNAPSSVVTKHRSVRMRRTGLLCSPWRRPALTQ